MLVASAVPPASLHALGHCTGPPAAAVAACFLAAALVRWVSTDVEPFCWQGWHCLRALQHQQQLDLLGLLEGVSAWGQEGA